VRPARSGGQRRTNGSACSMWRALNSKRFKARSTGSR
jgi:hypothetical protein